MTPLRSGLASRARIAAACALAQFATAVAADAQTDYYNTDRGRPLTTEDATAVEWRALEVQLAPLRLERARGQFTWGIEPEIAWGFAPRTQIEIGAPVVFRDALTGGTASAPSSRSSAALAGMELSVLHSLNVETSIPAFAIAASAHLPVGGAAPSRATYSVTGIATRTFPSFRIHTNVEVGIGASDDVREDTDATRWQAGVAIDKPFPLQAMLIGVELVARAPRGDDVDPQWHSTTGVRYQVSPRVALDAGGGYRFGSASARAERGWFATIGAAFVVGMPWRGSR